MSWPSTGATLSPMSSTTRPSRSLMTRRVPSRPASSFWNASSMPSWPRSSTLVKPTTCAAASPSGYLRLYSRTSWMPLMPSASPALATCSSTWRRSQTKFGLSSRRALELGAGHVEQLRELARAAPRRPRSPSGSPRSTAPECSTRGSGRCGRRSGRGSPAARACGRSGSRPASGRTARADDLHVDARGRAARRSRGRPARPAASSATAASATRAAGWSSS